MEGNGIDLFDRLERPATAREDHYVSVHIHGARRCRRGIKSERLFGELEELIGY